jgi:hypothetical protein
MHALAKMPDNMLKFGMASNFCRKIGERALKGIVKDHAQQTQRRSDSFAQQCALQEYETNLLRYMMSDIEGQLGLSTQIQTVSRDAFKTKGQYTLTMSPTNRAGIGLSPDKVSWHCPKRECLKCNVSDLLTFALQNIHMSMATLICTKLQDILR